MDFACHFRKKRQNAERYAERTGVIFPGYMDSVRGMENVWTSH